jgi:multisubunit Na+/H+ antiporter MnhB subunit
MRAFQCWLLTAVGFLTMNLGSEWLARYLKSEAVGLGPAGRALFRMVVLGLAFAIAADLIHPYLQGYLKRLHGALRPGRGATAGVLGALALVAALYFGYYYTYR